MADSVMHRRIQIPLKLPTYVITLYRVIHPVLLIAKIAIGAVYLHDCPLQQYIPIYLIVLGVVGLMMALVTHLPCAQEPKDGSSNPLRVIYTTWTYIALLFTLCWFITGNVWIYSIYQPNYNETTTDYNPYCNKTLYLFAFCTTAIANIWFCLFMFIICYVIICGRADTADDV